MLFALITLVATAGLSPLFILAGRRLRVLDAPGRRKQHDDAVPRTGGLALVSGLAVGIGAAGVSALLALPDSGLAAALPFAVPVAVIFGVGLWEDVRGCPVIIRLFAQAIAGLLFIGGSTAFDSLSDRFGGGTIVILVVALLWLMGVTNAMNFFDGLDGLAPGGAAVIAGSLAIVSTANGDQGLAITALVLCGACLGFLGYNWRPARIFLGDSGSLTLGFALGSLALVNSLRADTVVGFLVPLLLVAIPTIDALLVIICRFCDQTLVGIPARLRRTIQADRRHLHHRLLAVAGPGTVVLIMHSMVVASCLLALLALLTDSLPFAAITLLVEIVAVAFLRSARHRRIGRAIRLGQTVSGDRRHAALIRSGTLRLGRLVN